MPNIQQLIKALRKENLEPKIEDEKVCNNTLNVLTFSGTGVQIWLNDNADIEYCWDNGIMVGGAGGGIKTDKLSSTIKFITEYIKKYHPTIETDVPLKENPLDKIIEQYENSLKSKESNIGIADVKKYSNYIKKVGVSVNEYILILKEINKHEEDNLEYDTDTPIEEFSELTYEDILELMREDSFDSNIVQKVMYNRNGADVKEWQKVEELKEALYQTIKQKTTQEETETQKSKPNRQK